jgi:hypothetical protein
MDLQGHVRKVNSAKLMTIHTDVGCWTPILKIAVALSGNMSGYTDRCTTIGNARTESTNVSSFVTTGQSHVVVVSVNSDMFIVFLGQLLDRSLDVLHTSRFAHPFGAVVGMASSAVPFSLQNFGVERHLDTPLLSDANQKISCHPEVIAHRDSFARTNLELPLRRHHLGVDTTDVDAGIQAGAVMSFDEVTSENFAGTYKVY